MSRSPPTPPPFPKAPLLSPIVETSENESTISNIEDKTTLPISGTLNISQESDLIDRSQDSDSYPLSDDETSVPFKRRFALTPQRIKKIIDNSLVVKKDETPSPSEMYQEGDLLFHANGTPVLDIDGTQKRAPPPPTTSKSESGTSTSSGEGNGDKDKDKKSGENGAPNANKTKEKSRPPASTAFKKSSEITRLIRHEFSGKVDELQPFLDDANLAASICPDEFVPNLYTEIVSHITKSARSELDGRDFKDWEALKEHLKKKYKYRYTFNQMCDQLASVYQKPNEKTEAYADRIRDLVWKATEIGIAENKNKDFIAAVLNTSALNRFKLHSLPEMSRFLRVRNVKTFDEAVLDALEEERTILATNKFCKRCNSNTHSLSECTRKFPSSNSGHQNYNQEKKVCRFCKLIGHTIGECRKRAFHERNKKNNPSHSSSNNSHPSPSVQNTSTITCAYCKRVGHMLKNCYKLKNKESLKPSNKSSPKTTSANAEVNVRKSVQMIAPRIHVLQPSCYMKTYVHLQSSFLKVKSLPFLVDTGAEVSIIPIEFIKNENLHLIETLRIPESLQAIAGELTCLGTIFLPFKFGDVSFDFKFHIVRQKDVGTSENGILGNNILQTVKADIKHSSMVLSLTTLGICLPLSKTRDRVPFIVTGKSVNKIPFVVSQKKTTSSSDEVKSSLSVFDSLIHNDLNLNDAAVNDKEVPSSSTNQEIPSSFISGSISSEVPPSLLPMTEPISSPETFAREKDPTLDLSESSRPITLSVSALSQPTEESIAQDHTYAQHKEDYENYNSLLCDEDISQINDLSLDSFEVIDSDNLNPSIANLSSSNKRTEKVLSQLRTKHMSVGFSSSSIINNSDPFLTESSKPVSLSEAALSQPSSEFILQELSFATYPKKEFETFISLLCNEDINDIYLSLDSFVVKDSENLKNSLSDSGHKTTVPLQLRLKQKFQDYKQRILICQATLEFFMHKILYLGHVVSADGIQPNPEKTKVLNNYPVPTKVKEVQRFLGLTGYYRKFIPNYASISKPLTKLLKKTEPFVWSEAQQKSFEKLIGMLMSDLILVHPNFEKTFYLFCDASKFAIGACLQQKDISNSLRPLCYASRTLNRHEQNYATIEQEALSIIWAVKHFRPYLFGHHFEILSDHKPLIWLFKANDPGSRLLRWRLKLEEYNYTISHIPGTKNTVADTLSRLKQVSAVTRSQARAQLQNPTVQISKDVCFHTPLPSKDITQVNNILVFTTPDLVSSSPLTKNFNITGVKGEIHRHRAHQKSFYLIFYKQTKNEIFSKINLENILGTLKPVLEKFNVIEASLFDEINSFEHEDIPVIERILSSSLPDIQLSWLQIGQIPDDKFEVLQKYHEHALTGHPGNHRLYELLRQNGFYWFGMQADIRYFLRNCMQCQIMKTNRNPTKLPMVITDTPTLPIEKISMDIVGPLPLTINGNRFILSLQDNLTKFLCLQPIPVHTAEVVVRGLLQFFSMFGLPKHIVSDQGTEFRSNLLNEMNTSLGIDHILCSPYHPESNGALERTHSSIKEFLRFYVDASKDSWDTFLPSAVFSFNNSVHATTNFTPFELMYGRKVTLENNNLTYNDYFSSLLDKFEMLHRKTRENIKNKKEKYKEKYDETHQSPFFQYWPGHFALVQDLSSGIARKLNPRYKGPYKVIRIKFPNVTLDVKGQEKTYHANLLKPFFQSFSS